MFISLMETLSQGATGVILAGLALIFMGLALIRMSPEWMVAAAFLAVPSTYTAGSGSGILLVMRLLPLLQLLAAYAIEKEETLLAWLCAAPTLLALGYLLYTITVNLEAVRLLMN